MGFLNVPQRSVNRKDFGRFCGCALLCPLLLPYLPASVATVTIQQRMPFDVMTMSSKDGEERQSFPGDKVMFAFRLASTFALLLLVGACGSPSSPTSAVASAPSSSSTPVAAPTASPAPVGWVTYKEPAWGYSISMPAAWHLATAGQQDPAQFKSFSFENVTNAATLAGLDANGMVLTVTVSHLNSGCPGDQPPVGFPQSTVPAVAVNIDGYTSVVTGAEAQDLSVWSVQAEAATSKYCYSFVGLTLNHNSQLKLTPLFEQMLSTFTFGTLIAPPF
jgi:hypothetical protein